MNLIDASVESWPTSVITALTLTATAKKMNFSTESVRVNVNMKSVSANLGEIRASLIECPGENVNEKRESPRNNMHFRG